MNSIRLRDAQTDPQVADFERLVAMNLELIEDEAYDVPRTRDLVTQRMREFLMVDGDFRVFVLPTEGDADASNGEAPTTTLAGYAVVDISREPVYLRQFYICRDQRRAGYGRAAFEQLCQTLSVEQMDVEVMAWNEAGRQFWRSLGFQHRYEGLRWRKS